MDDMDDFRSLAQGSIFYDQIKVVVDMNNSWSRGQGSRCYE